MIQERLRAGLTRLRDAGKRLGWPPIAPALEKRIREALATPGRPGMRKIAARFGVNPGTGSGSAALSTRAWSAASGEGVAMFQMLGIFAEFEWTIIANESIQDGTVRV